VWPKKSSRNYILREFLDKVHTLKKRRAESDEENTAQGGQGGDSLEEHAVNHKEPRADEERKAESWKWDSRPHHENKLRTDLMKNVKFARPPIILFKSSRPALERPQTH
jgi:hypothetical protein